MDEYQENRMPLIGDMAPAFHAVTTQGEINFPMDYLGRWVILFSHPADFTPVCTTEFMTFASMINEFKALNTELIGLSIDSIYSHIAWLRKIQELSWKDIKHVEVTFPLIEDITMDISKKYGMLHHMSDTQTVRAVFIIDPEGKIRAILYYPASTGRNIEEIKRMIIALQKADCEGVATPANWMPCDDVILPPPGSCGAARERLERMDEYMYCIDWFLCFKQSNCTPCDYEYQSHPHYLPDYPNRSRNLYHR
ncbi:peroxiredoxin [Mobilitalea sibirica]|uniref:Peroxiredoxin n=1 Tax=Mobilitalea sibirica TaxID=1462919 RepID=A0A8J7HAC0_9FIRM|nr:peroxiredoxin [Mobilitalea sibirica]MBH1941405.1 peroxiredoxin [Mobilitalea sibirica]